MKNTFLLPACVGGKVPGLLAWSSGHVVAPLALSVDTLLFQPQHHRLLHLSAAFSCWLSTLEGALLVWIFTQVTLNIYTYTHTCSSVHMWKDFHRIRTKCVAAPLVSAGSCQQLINLYEVSKCRVAVGLLLNGSQEKEKILPARLAISSRRPNACYVNSKLISIPALSFSHC